MALDKMRIVGGNRLQGEILTSGSKNAALPLLAMTLLTRDPCELTAVPDLLDIQNMIKILRILGVDLTFLNHTVNAQTIKLNQVEAPYDFVRKMRASVLLLGPLLAKCGFARVSMPGGCAIGVRPINLHLKAFEALGAEIELKEGYVEAKASRLKGAEHTFESVTVTGTINALMAASLAVGESVFHNCAQEPEVFLTGEVLSKMGATVDGAGTKTIRIRGRNELKGFRADMIPDRIEAGTYLVASAITEGELFLRGANAEHLGAVIQKLRDCGAEIVEDVSGIFVKGKKLILPLEIQTAPFPGFPTDMQAQFMVLLSLARGRSLVHETIFENRFMHVAELIRMGADLKIKGPEVTIEGVQKLKGAPVMATDLRASASLVLAGLVSEGVTEVSRIYHLDRGYERMETKLASVGADIVRIMNQPEVEK